MKYNIQLFNRGLKGVTFCLILPFVNKKGVEEEEEVVVSGKCTIFGHYPNWLYRLEHQK